MKKSPHTQRILLSTYSQSQTLSNQFEKKKTKLVDNEKPSSPKNTCVVDSKYPITMKKTIQCLHRYT